MSYPLEDLGSENCSLPEETHDVVDRLARATDVLDLLGRADAVTPPEIDLWSALVLGEQSELYVHCPGPLSPTLAMAVAESMGDEAAAWGDGRGDMRAAADRARFSYARLNRQVLSDLSDAYRDHITQRGDGLVAVARAAATEARSLTLDRWRQADEALEVIAWMLGTLCDEDRPDASVTDSISGAYTREFFEQTLRNELWRSERQPAELSIILLQLRRSSPMLADHWPPPRLLARTAAVMRAQLRRADVVARLDSRRLAGLLPTTGPRNALIAAGRLGEALQDDHELEGWSIDIGVSGVGMETTSVDELLDQARHAMLSAQRGALNCPFVYV